MKIFSILGGLGSQMQKYAFYLAVKEKTSQLCFIDTTYYLQKQSWNGFELKKIFDVQATDLIDILPNDAIERIINNKKSYLSEVLTFLSSNQPVDYYFLGLKSKYRKYTFRSEMFRLLKHKIMMGITLMGYQNVYTDDVYTEENSSYFDEFLMNSDELFRDIKPIIIETFRFPKFLDEKNVKIATAMSEGNSVAIHVRRTDHLGDNGLLYKRKYYKKSVNFIKEQSTEKLYFYIFSDDLQWCKQNLLELGLTSSDYVVFVDWNSGENSYKDMQLMTYCQHNVIAISSFSWWGYYLSFMENKIVCAPNGYWTDVENHF